MLLEEILKVNKRVVLVLMNGRPLTLEWEDKHLPAIVEAWHLGEQSGNAIADILFGDFNPSGKLTITFPRCVGQIPIYYNHKNTGRPTFKKYLDVEETPLYPFGYGLSYTKFEYLDLELSKEEIKLGEKMTAKAKIKNVGDREGEEIVQLYIRDISASITRPVKELKGFKR
ncbi:glycoside hydrolase family 3 C-terminal domain-containing protein [Caloramator sp. Dgby_cultured_2]|uniref:glycoside hydrolase family 3 C-terminal domain-containing protein n=1 Tax=Caloramator sp. Dgby_cultured_2 TaxID=3029174 RepID=UPI00237E2DDE|nr:glycoside hydrolase family 3 C-terminal domain-containing protein [Caloramator sp. Dgby_cultured_2]WDU82859.1 glycoside hydrolase family 3 C-terminal domain-containing protein [Caloramator sp. Dgby_cultured_2]